jgi:hypothetical protein
MILRKWIILNGLAGSGVLLSEAVAADEHSRYCLPHIIGNRPSDKGGVEEEKAVKGGKSS